VRRVEKGEVLRWMEEMNLPGKGNPGNIGKLAVIQ